MFTEMLFLILFCTIMKDNKDKNPMNWIFIMYNYLPRV